MGGAMSKIFGGGLIPAVLILLIGFYGLALSGAKPAKISLPDGYVDRYYKNMRYGLFVPPSYTPQKKYPLVVYLHGSTDTTSWDLQWYHDPILTNDPCIVLTPKSLKRKNGWGNSWQSRHSPDMKKTMAVIALIRQEFNIDSDRIYINGTSMGGFGTLSALTKEPDLFAAGFVICGGGDANKIDALVNVPLWLFHGSEDPVVPVDLSRNIYQAVRAAGGQLIRYTEYPGVGHSAWEPAGKEPTRDAWLLAQRKGATHGIPDPVSNVLAVKINDHRLQLTWDLPSNKTNSDNQIWYCQVYRNGQVIAMVDNIALSYTDTTVSVGATYQYSISAVNYFFKESAKSTPLQITIP